MSVTAGSLNATLSATETLVVNLDGSDDPSVTESLSVSVSLGPGTTPPVSEQWYDVRALAAGTDTIDLTSLTKGNLSALDLTGLRIRAITIQAGANSAVLNVAPGVSNGYDLFGASNDVDIPANGSITFYPNAGAPIVATADAEIDITSSDTDATYTVQILAG